MKLHYGRSIKDESGETGKGQNMEGFEAKDSRI